jgi:hypothetical protein
MRPKVVCGNWKMLGLLRRRAAWRRLIFYLVVGLGLYYGSEAPESLGLSLGGLLSLEVSLGIEQGCVTTVALHREGGYLSRQCSMLGFGFSVLVGTGWQCKWDEGIVFMMASSSSFRYVTVLLLEKLSTGGTAAGGTVPSV